MENVNLLDTKTVNCNEVLGNGKKYFVPIFQRDYSWNEDNWEDLWSDIILVSESNAKHYMGAIVLQSHGNKSFAVIDGQQRLTTISLIALACIDFLKQLANENIDTLENEERAKLLSNKFIGEKDPSSLTYFSKLKLNGNNNSFFQSYLLTFRNPPSLRTLKDSDKLLLKAFDFFKSKIAFQFENIKDGKIIAQFLNDIIAEKLVFIQIIVENELRAYNVFETLNSRGVGLTVTDLLKNYLFSLAAEVDLPHIRVQWDRIVDSIGLDEFPNFLRNYWISRNKIVRAEYLFKSIRAKIQNTNDLFNLLDDLERNLVIYLAINNSSDLFWRSNKVIRKSIKELEIFGLKQSLPLLLIAFEKTPQLFENILHLVSVITFRSSVIAKLQNGKLEAVYNRTALKIFNNELSSIQQIAKELKELYINDTDFRNDFSTISFNTRKYKKLIRYILFEIENQMSNNENVYDFEENPATIEHILPVNESDEWNEFFPKNIIDDYLFRLANYTLLEFGLNKEIANQTFEKKQEAYKASSFVMTKNINYPDWNPNILDKRQMQMAKIATTIWKVSYYQ